MGTTRKFGQFKDYQSAHSYLQQQAGQDNGALESFADLLEKAERNQQGFPGFLKQLLEEDWHISPQDFRRLLIVKLDHRIAQLKKRSDYDFDKLPHALQRYIQERPELVKEMEGDGFYKQHPVIPSAPTILNWMTGFSRPDGTQLALMAEVFSLFPTDEHRLWKVVQGHRLTVAQLMQSLDKGNSGATNALLMRASGFTDERLAELVGVSKKTIYSWTDPHVISYQVQDVQSAGTFATLLTNCLKTDSGAEPPAWQLSSMRRSIISRLAGHDVSKCPDSPQEAAAHFQIMLEEAFSKGQSFSSFISQMLKEWETGSKYLDFINQNNAKKGDTDPPISVNTFHAWETGEAVPQVVNMRKIISGTFLSRPQELMLWKMVHGKAITPDEIRADIAAGNSAKLLNHLMEASGITLDRFASMFDIQKSNFQEWRNEGKPSRITQISRAREFASVLLTHVNWGEAKPTEEQVADLRESVVENLTGRAFRKSLYEIAVDAVGHENARGRLAQLLCDKADMANDEIAQLCGMSVKALFNLKMGERECSESEALKLIGIAGGGETDEIIEATNILTRTRSPEEMLQLAKQGKIEIGMICEETRNRRHETRKDIQDRTGVSKSVVEAFEKNTRNSPLELTKAYSLASYIGYSYARRREFVLLATGKKIVPLHDILADAETLKVTEQETMRRICEQTAMPMPALADALQIPATQLADYCDGKTGNLSITADQLRKLVSLFTEPADLRCARRLKEIYIPNITRGMQLAAAGRKERSGLLTEILDKAGMPPAVLQEEFSLAASIAASPQLLMKDACLDDVLAVAAERLDLSASEYYWLQTLYDPALIDKENAVAGHMEDFRKQLISGIVGGAVEHSAKWQQLLHGKEQSLAVLDAFNSTLNNRDTKSALATVRAFLADELVIDHANEGILENAFRVTAHTITNAHAPDGMTDDKDGRKQWRGIVFDTINKSLFRKLCERREHLGIGNGIHAIAPDGVSARLQKMQLMADSEGRAILTAVMATNNGNVARLASRLFELPQYKDDDNQKQLLQELWLGSKITDDGTALMGGALEVFLKWNPSIARITTYLEKPVRWHIHRIYQEQKDPVEKSGLLNDAGPGEDGPSGNKIDQVAYRDYKRSKQNDHSDPEEVSDLLGKIRKAVSMLPPREKAMLTAVFDSILEGKPLMLHEMTPVSKGAKSETVSKERTRQIRASAYSKFMQAWEVVADPGDEIPVGLEKFLENMKSNEAPDQPRR